MTRINDNEQSIKRNNVTVEDFVPQLPPTPRLQPEDMPDEALAQFVAQTFVKLTAVLPYIHNLKNRFANLNRNDDRTIAGCHTWTEFCERVLHRTDAAIRVAIKREKDKAKLASAEEQPAQEDADSTPPSKEKPEYVPPPAHLQAVHDLRAWMESETPHAAKRICVKPCGHGYGAGMGQHLPGELQPSFDMELRNLTAEEVKKIGAFVEPLAQPTLVLLASRRGRK